jgi:hypothetical protein
MASLSSPEEKPAPAAATAAATAAKAGVGRQNHDDSNTVLLLADADADPAPELDQQQQTQQPVTLSGPIQQQPPPQPATPMSSPHDEGHVDGDDDAADDVAETVASDNKRRRISLTNAAPRDDRQILGQLLNNLGSGPTAMSMNVPDVATVVKLTTVATSGTFMDMAVEQVAALLRGRNVHTEHVWHVDDRVFECGPFIC